MRRFKVYLLSLVIAFFISGCVEKEINYLNIGTNPWLGYETLYLARSLGYFEKTPVRFIELGSATAVSQAFKHELLDVAALTLDETLTLMQTEPDIRVILVLDVSRGADALLVSPDIKQLSALKGKRIGVENSAVGAVMLSAALDAASLTIADVDLIPLTVDQHLLAYKKDLVDAVVSFEPMKTRLIKEQAHVLFDSSQLEGQIVDVLVTRQSVIEKRPEVLLNLVQMYFQAHTYLSVHQQDAVSRIMPRLSLDHNEILNGYKDLELADRQINQNLLSGKKPNLLITVDKLMLLMLERELLSKNFPHTLLITDEFIQ